LLLNGERKAGLGFERGGNRETEMENVEMRSDKDSRVPVGIWSKTTQDSLRSLILDYS